MNLQDGHRVLGTTPFSSPEDIKKSFRERAKIFHPDRPSGSKEQFQILSLAYTTVLESVSKPSQSYYKKPPPRRSPPIGSLSPEEMKLTKYYRSIDIGGNVAPETIIQVNVDSSSPKKFVLFIMINKTQEVFFIVDREKLINYVLQYRGKKYKMNIVYTNRKYFIF